MSSIFPRNIHFTSLLKTSGRLREFNFRRLPSPSSSLFHVDVPDDRGNRIMFRMQRDEAGQWRIEPQSLPAWITGSEQRLHELIVAALV